MGKGRREFWTEFNNLIIIPTQSIMGTVHLSELDSVWFQCISDTVQALKLVGCGAQRVSLPIIPPRY